MRLGIVVATKEERKPFVEVFGEPPIKYPKETGYEVFRWDLEQGSALYLIQSGFGEISATSSTQYLIDKFRVESIINYGVVGGLKDCYSVGRLGFVKEVIHYDFDISVGGRYIPGEYPEKGRYLRPYKEAIPEGMLKHHGLTEFICASGDKFIGAGEPKKKLNREFGAEICEMEAAGILITCNRNRIPVTFIKAISDGVNEDTEAFDKNVYQASLKCVNFLHKIIVGA